MIPGNADPRRPDKVQRYKPANSSSSNTSGEDLTPDYMNILGPESTTGNVQADNSNENIKSTPAKPQPNQQQTVKVNDDASKSSKEAPPTNITNSSNVIPTSPQYGLAIIPTTSNDIPTEVITPASDSIVESTVKTTDSDIKDMHSTPSKNDRFKVVKIASSEPFRRGRWKCMDYVDQVPTSTSSQQTKTSQGTTGVQMAGNVYMQTQSLPPQQIQQMLLQGAFTTSQPQQYYQNNIQSQIQPQTQYFYQPVQNQGSTQPQILSSGGGVPPSSVQPQFINSTQQQQYFQTPVMPQNYQNLQFAQAATYPNQNSAFVPTTQNVQNFQQQQGQTYSSQPPVTQPQSASQPMVNGFAYTTQTVADQPSNHPTQVAKNVILNSVSQVVQTQAGGPIPNHQESQPNSATRQTSEQNPTTYQQLPPQNVNPSAVAATVQPINQNVVVQQTKDVYTNPQFVSTVQHSGLPTGETNEVQVTEATESNAETTGGNPDDPTKAIPVVNAIDNKIEQAMDLVKSHLMYTVREEVEVLKEKIAELMERIQQLESENNFLRSQIPKSNPNSNGPTEPSPQQ